mmetsp:Transcript_5901/g.21066  ORF Transcript_5901/g.21066 Transcript_5901/m.21066 type:complete len:109 (-) Transcript_5901:255-581(-)
MSLSADATDQLMQRAIREHFAESTVITVAHRLHTLADASRILLLSDGRVAEFDAPAALLADASSHFSRLVAELGPHAEGKLRDAIAEAATASPATSALASTPTVSVAP